MSWTILEVQEKKSLKNWRERIGWLNLKNEKKRGKEKEKRNWKWRILKNKKDGSTVEGIEGFNLV